MQKSLFGFASSKLVLLFLMMLSCVFLVGCDSESISEPSELSQAQLELEKEKLALEKEKLNLEREKLKLQAKLQEQTQASSDHQDLDSPTELWIPGRFPMTRTTRNISPQFVEESGLNCTDLVIMRNEIYARYGRHFQNKSLHTYFMAQDWYEPNPNYRDDLLTEVERLNASDILDIEQLKGCL